VISGENPGENAPEMRDFQLSDFTGQLTSQNLPSPKLLKIAG
jgi:hypothetical protein